MNRYHKLLNRQIKKYISQEIDISELDAFFSAVSDAYYAFDDDQLMAERSLDISSDELNQVIEELRRAQGTLVNQEKMAAIGHLAAGVAHEINNPLSYIVSNFSTLGEYVMILEKYMYELDALCLANNDTKAHAELTRLKEKLQLNFIMDEIPEVILDSNSGLLKIRRIVNGLRHFSGVDQSDVYGWIDLQDSIENTLIVTENEVKQVADVFLEFDDVPAVRGNASEMNQVILNLVLNAIDAIREKDIQGTIDIRTYQEDSYACFSIQDNGVGMPKHIAGSIFNPFFTTKPVGAGTGLGLSIAYDIVVNKHHGIIDVKSKNGEGTTMTVKLPLDQ